MAQKPKAITNSIGMKLVLIPKGTFTMGTPLDEVGSEDDERQHQVTISKDYYLGIFEVTQAQYKKVTGRNPSQLNGQVLAERIPAKKHPVTGRTVEKAKIIPKDTSDFPVDSVTWDDAVYFCERLSGLSEEKRAGRVYRLPTEAEWEFACRAGSKTAYSFGDDKKTLADYGWYYGNSSENVSSHRTHPVGEKKPNAWGLFDMHGNASEWCLDWYGDYSDIAVTDPRGPSSGSDSLGDGRVLRGGGYRWDAVGCRSAARNSCSPSYRSQHNGFRVTMIPPAQ
ncbi:formylglycine-generating enzyme family protein [Planctomycetaceae bacterium SH139]